MLDPKRNRRRIVPDGANSLAYGEDRVINQYDRYGAERLGIWGVGTAARFEVEARDRFNNRINRGKYTITGSLFHTVHNQRTFFIDEEARLNSTSPPYPPPPFPPCTDTEDGECAVILDNEDGTFDVSYRVTLSGIYKLKIEIEGQDLSSGATLWRGRPGAAGFTSTWTPRQRLRHFARLVL